MSIKCERKLIAVDCDGTFFDINGYPSAKTCAVVQRTIDAGHFIVASTGRSHWSAASRLSSVPGMHYLVCSNGAYVWGVNEASTLWGQTMSPSLVEQLMSTLSSGHPEFAFGWETSLGIEYDPVFLELAGGISELESGGQAIDPSTQRVFKLFVRCPQMSRHTLHEQVFSLLANSGCEITTSGAPFVEITASGVNKAFGLLNVANFLGVSADNAIVFGDQHNDLPMFRWAGHAVAMGNAIDSVKEESDAITLPNTQHGVAIYLQAMLDSGEL